MRCYPGEIKVKEAGPPPGRLIAGLIYSETISLEEIVQELETVFCDVERLSRTVPFSWTSYYEKEMGHGLSRTFLVFDCLVPQDFLVEAKHRSIHLEEKWKHHGRRKVNIDPGILTGERVVLATTKNFTHRIYLGKAIFADLTLIYRKGGFRPLGWTYPDYSEKWALDFWNVVRRGYLEKIRKMTGMVTPHGTNYADIV